MKVFYIAGITNSIIVRYVLVTTDIAMIFQGNNMACIIPIQFPNLIRLSPTGHSPELSG